MLAYSIPALTELMEQSGQPAYRSVQVLEWVYGRGVARIEDMTNLPASLRTYLAENHPLIVPSVVDRQDSHDGTRKYLLQLSDGALVEAVGIPSHDSSKGGRPRRLTVCVSTQVGCSMACAFCATGTQGYLRNLLPGEIAQQVIVVAHDMDSPPTNVVLMGQGEPFLNYDNAVAGLRILNHERGLGIGARHLTVSTCGMPEAIRVFAGEPEQFTLAVSLHAARQSVRDRLMPRCASMPLHSLRDSLVDYYDACNRRVSLEYLLLEGVNAGEEDFEALREFCRGLHAHVNLLPFNAVGGSCFSPAPAAVFRAWEDGLGRAGIPVSVRSSRGSDISAACGQLANKKSSG